MLILLILALVFTFRYACRMWLYSNCGIKLSPLAGFEDADKLYDAYVCYSPNDEEFVIESLSRELENGYPSYHLCLHYRDVPQFEATYAQFPDLVVEATEASRRIIVVLTKNFIKTEWTRVEFRQALQRALRKNPHKLIIVTAGPIPRDPDLKSYFKMGLEVTWKEKRFWERLRYAMPSSKRRGQKLKRLNYGRNSNTYTMDASVLNSTCQTLCGKSATSAERSPCDRPLSEHIYSTIESDYSSADRTEYHHRHDYPQSIVLEHTVQTYLVNAANPATLVIEEAVNNNGGAGNFEDRHSDVDPPHDGETSTEVLQALTPVPEGKSGVNFGEFQNASRLCEAGEWRNHSDFSNCTERIANVSPTDVTSLIYLAGYSLSLAVLSLT